MLFTRLISRLFGGSLGSQTSHGRRSSQPRSFVPRLTALEDRMVPSGFEGHFGHHGQHAIAGHHDHGHDTHVVSFPVTGKGGTPDGLPNTINDTSPYHF